MILGRVEEMDMIINISHWLNIISFGDDKKCKKSLISYFKTSADNIIEVYAWGAQTLSFIIVTHY